MDESNLQAQIDAAKAYETLFVPALFGQWANKLLDAAQVQAGQRVLDVACGTGVVARAAITRVGPNGQVAGIDPNPGMVAVAKQLEPRVDWRTGVAESLAFPNESFDAVVSQFGLMFFTDRPQALREMVRILVPSGHLAVAVWDSLDNIPAYATEVALLERTAGPAAAAALSAPFVLGKRADLETLFRDAGVAGAEITTHAGTAHFPNIRTLVEADLRGWLPIMGVNLTEEQIPHILQAAEQDLSAYVSADGRAAFPVSAQFITARKQ
jgi:SAM-dependent methyltransferase